MAPSAARIQAVVDQALTQRLGLPARLAIERKKREGDWIFLCGKPQMPDGTGLDYSRTTLRGRQEAGTLDDYACALLNQRNNDVALKELTVGDTDAPFVDWPGRYGIPGSILSAH